MTEKEVPFGQQEECEGCENIVQIYFPNKPEMSSKPVCSIGEEARIQIKHLIEYFGRATLLEQVPDSCPSSDFIKNRDLIRSK